MATDSPSTGEAPPMRVENEATDHAPRPSYDARLGATCMIWVMFIGLGIMVAMIIIWMASNFGSI